MKKTISLFLILALLVGVAACGGKGDAGNDPNLGLWIAQSGEMWGESVDVAFLFDGGFAIELKAGGKCTVDADGEKGNGTWTLKDGVFTAKAGGVNLSGTLANGRLTLEDVMGMGLTLILLKQGSVPADGGAGDSSVVDDPVAAPALPASLAWWDGEWYGYWKATSASGSLANLEGDLWDCYAFIDVNPDGTAMMYVWDDEIEMASVEILIEESGGVGPMGSAVSTGGEAFDVLLKRADWVIMPTTADYKDYWGNAWYDDYMEFEGSCRTDDGEMDYTIVLRPWGIKWDDVPADKQPPAYETWYVKNGYYNWYYMLEALEESTLDGEPVFIHPVFAASGRVTGGGGTGNTTDGPAAPGNDSGGTADSTALIGRYGRVGDDPEYYYIELFADGTCVLCVVGIKMEGTYTVSGNNLVLKSVEFDDTIPTTIDGNKITRGQGYGQDVYVKE